MSPPLTLTDLVFALFGACSDALLSVCPGVEPTRLRSDAPTCCPRETDLFYEDSTSETASIMGFSFFAFPSRTAEGLVDFGRRSSSSSFIDPCDSLSFEVLTSAAEYFACSFSNPDFLGGCFLFSGC
jgi:hypothetical protein